MGNSTSQLPTSFSVSSPDAAKPGEGTARRFTAAAPPTVSKFGPDIDSLPKQFIKARELYGENSCFGTRVKNSDGTLGGYEWVTYNQVYDECVKVSSAVAGLGLGKGDYCGMYATNSAVWQMCAIGSMFQSLACVPIYDTLGEDIVKYEVNHAPLKLIFVDANKLGKVAAVLKECPTLKFVVQIEPLASSPAASAADFAAAGVTLTDLDSLRASGVAKPMPFNLPSGDELAFIMYTSGTTGDPKGVCIKHLGITIGSSYCGGLELLPTDRYLSYLPLAHIFETMVEHALMAGGASIGFYNGNVKKLQDDILALRPTVFVGVPRVYLRFYEAAFQKVEALAAPLKKLLLHALDVEMKNAKEGVKTGWGLLLAKLLGAKITGGSVRVMITGAAPLPAYVHEFLVAAIGAPVLQGYGMTENCANATLMRESDYRGGHVGPPVPTVDVKLVDVPEMDYTTAGNNSGEVCTQSPCNFAGYHKNPEETAKVLTADNWLHTGDIGRWGPDGVLYIIDRKKNIFKLSQGEYVAAEKIEMAIGKSKYISQPWVYGNSFLPMLVAVVVPAFDELRAAGIAAGWAEASTSTVELAASPKAKELILAEIVSEAKTAKLKSFEVPKAVCLEGTINELNQGFSIENDCLTPTFKVKRPQLLKKYQSEIDAMYVALGEDPTKARPTK